MQKVYNMENLFFDKRDLKYCGENVIIGKTVRIRRPELVTVLDNVIIDDFIYISCGMNIENYVHIGPNCTFAGGKEGTIHIGEFSELSSGIRMYVSSSNYKGGMLASIAVPEIYQEKTLSEDIYVGKHGLIGTNSVILQGTIMPVGMAVGAMSLVKKGKKYNEWTLYAGNPLRELCKRDNTKILELEHLLRKQTSLI